MPQSNQITNSLFPVCNICAFLFLPQRNLQKCKDKWEEGKRERNKFLGEENKYFNFFCIKGFILCPFTELFLKLLLISGFLEVYRNEAFGMWCLKGNQHLAWRIKKVSAPFVTSQRTLSSSCVPCDGKRGNLNHWCLRLCQSVEIIACSFQKTFEDPASTAWAREDNEMVKTLLRRSLHSILCTTAWNLCV